MLLFGSIALTIVLGSFLVSGIFFITLGLYTKRKGKGGRPVNGTVTGAKRFAVRRFITWDWKGQSISSTAHWAISVRCGEVVPLLVNSRGEVLLVNTWLQNGTAAMILGAVLLSCVVGIPAWMLAT